MRDLLRVQRYLEGEQQHVQELVLFVETSCCVAEHLEREVLDDVGDSLVRNRRLHRVGESVVEYLKELTQGGLWVCR